MEKSSNEEDKGESKGFDDSYCDSSEYSSDSEEGGCSESAEEIKWTIGDKITDPAFPNECMQNFIMNNEINQLSKDKINTPYKCFRLFFTDSILDGIISESQKYFHQKVSAGLIKKTESDNSIYSLFVRNGFSKSDLLIFFGAIIFMSLNQKPDQKSHWSNGSYFSSKFLKRFITKGQYHMIKGILHLSDNIAHKNDHVFYKIESLMENLSSLYRKYYAPNQYLTVDESMASFKGRSKFKFYIPSKPTKWGFKIHCLCDSKTGYCLNYYIDPGKSAKKEENYTYNLVIKLIKPYLNKFHILTTDSFYSGIPLFEKLKNEHTGAIGIINKRRKGLPKDFVQSKNTKLVESVTNGTVVLVKWTDKKKIICASTIYNSDVMTLVKNKSEKVLPEVVCKYSESMRGVDIMDQEYRFPHRNKKWWHRIFHYVFEITTYNAFLIWKKGNPITCQTYLEFKKTLSKQLLRNGKIIDADEKKVIALPNQIKYQEKYYVEKTFLHDIIKEDDRLQCIQCKKSKVKTRCQQCSVAICAECFGKFHRELINKK